jgi:hypothetical protein
MGTTSHGPGAVSFCAGHTGTGRSRTRIDTRRSSPWQPANIGAISGVVAMPTSEGRWVHDEQVAPMIDMRRR